MIKQTIIAAGAVAAAVFAFQPQQAMAGPKVHFHIGVPYYDGYRPYYGHGPYYGHRHYYRPHLRRRISCRQARRMLRHRGFRRIQVRDCHGRRYVFTARRDGEWWRVRMSSRSGRIVRLYPI